MLDPHIIIKDKQMEECTLVGGPLAVPSKVTVEAGAMHITVPLWKKGIGVIGRAVFTRFASSSVFMYEHKEDINGKEIHARQ